MLWHVAPGGWKTESSERAAAGRKQYNGEHAATAASPSAQADTLNYYLDMSSSVPLNFPLEGLALHISSGECATTTDGPELMDGPGDDGLRGCWKKGHVGRRGVCLI